MPTYYVKHPNIQQDAKVEAPTSEKARTEFLDFLERHGSINRRDRQSIRRNLASERLRDPDFVEAQVNLDYGHSISSMPPLQVGFEPSLESEPIIPIEPSLEPEPAPTPALPLSPIAQVALRLRK